ncbi:MAG: hypothetical protein IJQ41_01105 [Firmicutes bacterium]|nr:hypothetical protein [Bacillota bacterium]MBQ4409193.1 hypothetical protein [Bacillota bacterium]MBQ6294341.1 hypothetical protein [Bacillota bacterium]MBR0209316.1 hypothetical protein [Bacillota bacterium]
MNRQFRILFVTVALLSASAMLVFADAALPPSPVEKSAPVAIPAAIVVAAVLIIRAIRNKR